MFKIKYKHFELNPEVQKQVVFLAGGLGITPIRSLVRSQRCSDVDWKLVHVAREHKHLYDKDLAAFDSRTVRTDHAGSAEAVLAAAESMPDAWFFVCGSARFVEGMQLLLAKGGIGPERVRVESFK